MGDSNKLVEHDEKENIIFNNDFIEDISKDRRVIKFLQKQFRRLSRSSAIILSKYLLAGSKNINAHLLTNKPKTLVYDNRSKFENDILKKDVVNNLQLLLNDFLLKIGKDLTPYTSDSKNEEEYIEIVGEQCFKVDCNTTYAKVRELIAKEGGDVCFKYNFDSDDMKLQVPKNQDTLQKVQIQLLSVGIKFDYPIEYFYYCTMCGTKDSRLAYETASTLSKIKCNGIRTVEKPDGTQQVRVCNNVLLPDNEISLTKDAYYYEISYDDENGNKHNVGGMSFEQYDPGFYECVLFKIKNPGKKELYQIINVKKLKDNIFVFPEKEEGINYLYTLQKSFDSFIKQQTGMEIWGLYPIKIAVIIQCVVNALKLKLIANIQVVGDSSTGKSTVLKYYNFLLNNQFNLNSNGMSISIPALRGTRQSIILMGKEQKVVTIGHLGTFKTICIDEAGDNKPLISTLKTFLLEDNYSYDKAGATGTFNKRTAHINLSENLDFAHLGQYIGSIRKAYKDNSVVIEDEKEKIPWDESWDLHLPIFRYTNPYLYRVVKEKRLEFAKKQAFWIDGYDIALHERFPFYFYLVREKKSQELINVVKGNVCRDTISENLELIKVLKSETIIQFFKCLEVYKDCDDDINGFLKVDEILEEYGLNVDVRMKAFYYMLVRISRIINKRNKINEEDYNLLRFFLETTNCKLDVVDTCNYDIIGPPNIKEAKELEIKIEDKTTFDGRFGMPQDEFD